MMLLSSSAQAMWIYVPPSYSSVQVGGWDASLVKWDTFFLSGYTDYILVSGVVPIVSPLSSVVPFPALTPDMLIQAQALNKNINPYANVGLPVGWFKASFDPLVASKLFGFAFLLVAISAAVGDGIGVMFRLLK